MMVIKFGTWNNAGLEKYSYQRMWAGKKTIFNLIPFLNIPYGWTPLCSRKLRYGKKDGEDNFPLN